ncbi:MAG: hypothetical protein AAF205_00210 [Pseudomonadota bacterium]
MTSRKREKLIRMMMLVRRAPPDPRKFSFHERRHHLPEFILTNLQMRQLRDVHRMYLRGRRR